MQSDASTGERCTIDPGKSYRVADVARIMDCSPNSVYRLIESGDLRSYRVGVSGVRVFGQVLAEYMGASA